MLARLLLLAFAAHATDDGHQADPGEDVWSVSAGFASRNGAEVTGLGAAWERGLLPGVSAALGGSVLYKGGLVRVDGRWSPWDPTTSGPAVEVVLGGSALIRPGGLQLHTGVRGGYQLGPVRPYAGLEVSPTWLRGEGEERVTWTRWSAGVSWRRTHRAGFWGGGAALDMWRAYPDDGGPLLGLHVWGAVGRHPLDQVSEGLDEVAWQALLPPPVEGADLVPEGIYRCARPIRGYLVFEGTEFVSWVPGDMGPQAFSEWLERRGDDVHRRREPVSRDRDIRQFYIGQAWWMARPVEEYGLALVRVRGADPRTSSCALVSPPPPDPAPE